MSSLLTRRKHAHECVFWDGSTGVNLLPVELKQLNYPTSTGGTDLGPTEERVIQSGTSAASIAYITGTPEMPKLQMRIGDGSVKGMTVEWSMDVTAERPQRGAKDNVHIPQTDAVTVVELPIEQPWNIYEKFIAPFDFVGGNCTVNYQIKDASGNCITSIQKYPFIVRGKNPKDADAMQCIKGAEGNYSYVWAIAQHESRQGRKVYNQFNAAEGIVGWPNYSADGKNGWGMFQRDDTNNGIYVDTRQVYGWTQNVQVAITELDQKWTTADRILRYFRNKYGAKPGWEEPPQNWPISNSMNFSAWDLATMILYNGSTGCPPSEVLNDGGQKITVTFPWTFDASRTPKWSFTDNVNGYATKIVADEWEGRQANEE